MGAQEKPRLLVGRRGFDLLHPRCAEGLRDLAEINRGLSPVYVLAPLILYALIQSSLTNAATIPTAPTIRAPSLIVIRCSSCVRRASRYSFVAKSRPARSNTSASASASASACAGGTPADLRRLANFRVSKVIALIIRLLAYFLHCTQKPAP